MILSIIGQLIGSFITLLFIALLALFIIVPIAAFLWWIFEGTEDDGDSRETSKKKKNYDDTKARTESSRLHSRDKNITDWNKTSKKPRSVKTTSLLAER